MLTYEYLFSCFALMLNLVRREYILRKPYLHASRQMSLAQIFSRELNALSQEPNPGSATIGRYLEEPKVKYSQKVS